MRTIVFCLRVVLDRVLAFLRAFLGSIRCKLVARLTLLANYPIADPVFEGLGWIAALRALMGTKAGFDIVKKTN